MKLKDARTGDTLCDRDAPVVLPDVPAANRPVAVAVHAKGGDDKAAAALHKLIEEDPSLELARSPDTGEMLLQGMGQAHIEVTVERVKRKHGVDIDARAAHAGLPRDDHRHLQGAGQVQAPDRRARPVRRRHVELYPKARGEGFEFEDAIVGGTIPRQFIPSVEKGIRGSLGSGPLAGYPVVDFKAKLVFGSYHDVDSSDMAFQVAGSMAFKKAVIEARPILLEPVMKLEVRVPEEYVGRRHGRPEQPPRQGAGHGAAGARRAGPGPLPARRGDDLRRRAALAHPGCGLLHHGALALRPRAARTSPRRSSRSGGRRGR